MKKVINSLIYTLIICFIQINYSCDTINDQTSYSGSLIGTIYDDSTKTGIPGVKVSCSDIPDTTQTGASGTFYFQKINMPRSEYTYYLKLERSSYYTDTAIVYMKSDTENKADSIFMKKIN